MIFLITSIVTLNLIAFFIPKRLTKIEIVSTILFSLIFQTQVDIFLDLKLDLYGYFSKGIDVSSLIPIYGLYPAVNVIILNFYPYLESTLIKLGYIVGWDFFLVSLEWALVKTGTFYHNGWKYWHSALAYPIIIVILAWFLSFLRTIRNK